MGVLDDAIREHLELRRRHGAPEGELERKQAEALGPARREVKPAKRAAPQKDAEPAAEPEPEPSLAADPDIDDDRLDPSDLPETELLGPDDAELDERFDPDRLRRAVADLGDDRSATVHDDLLASDEELIEAEPAAMSAEEEEAEYGAEGAPPRRFAPASDDEDPDTVESDALEDDYGRVDDAAPSMDDEDEVASDEGEEDGEDVLEETPDFLQETPEHDRLWFEQKPPRDFDLDDK